MTTGHALALLAVTRVAFKLSRFRRVACRAIGARVRWLHRLGAVSTTRPDIVHSARLARFGGGAKAAALVTLVAPWSPGDGRVHREGDDGGGCGGSGRDISRLRWKRDEERHEAFARRISRPSSFPASSSSPRGTRPNKAALARSLYFFFFLLFHIL